MALASLLNGKPNRSKFEEKGIGFANALHEMRQNKDKRIHTYQIDAVFAVNKFLMNERFGNTYPSLDPVLIVAPTGSGKSGIINMLPYILQSSRVLVLTPSIVITEQLGISCGVYKNKKCFLEKTICTTPEQLANLREPSKIIRNYHEVLNEHLLNLVIVNAQKFGGRSKISLSYRNEKIVQDVETFFQKFDTLIVDEAHHFPAPTWEKIYAQFCKPGAAGIQKKPPIFLTATPYRTGRKGDAVPILSRQRVAYTVRPKDVEGITIRKAKFRQESNFKDYRELAEIIIKLLDRNVKREPRISKPQAILLFRTKVEVEKCAGLLNEVTGDPLFSIPITSQGKKGAALEKQQKFTEEGSHRVAVTCGILNEGYDNSNVTLCVILRKIKAKGYFNQFIGRCMRMKKFEEGEPLDQSCATVLSFEMYEQQKMWDEKDNLAEVDPFDEDEEEATSYWIDIEN